MRRVLAGGVGFGVLEAAQDVVWMWRGKEPQTTWLQNAIHVANHGPGPRQMLDQVQGDYGAKFSVSESFCGSGIALNRAGPGGVLSGLFDGEVDQVDSRAAKVILQQPQQMPEAAAQFQQRPLPLRRMAPHQRRVIAARKPVNAEAPQATVCIIPP